MTQVMSTCPYTPRTEQSTSALIFISSLMSFLPDFIAISKPVSAPTSFPLFLLRLRFYLRLPHLHSLSVFVSVDCLCFHSPSPSSSPCPCHLLPDLRLRLRLSLPFPFLFSCLHLFHVSVSPSLCLRLYLHPVSSPSRSPSHRSQSRCAYFPFSCRRSANSPITASTPVCAGVVGRADWASPRGLPSPVSCLPVCTAGRLHSCSLQRHPIAATPRWIRGGAKAPERLSTARTTAWQHDGGESAWSPLRAAPALPACNKEPFMTCQRRSGRGPSLKPSKLPVGAAERQHVVPPGRRAAAAAAADGGPNPRQQSGLAGLAGSERRPVVSGRPGSESAAAGTRVGRDRTAGRAGTPGSLGGAAQNH